MFFEKSRGVQGIVSVQITFEKYTTNLYFEDESGINRQSVALISMKSFRMFMYFYAASFSIKVSLYEASNIFLSQALRRIFTKLFIVFESPIKVNVR